MTCTMLHDVKAASVPSSSCGIRHVASGDHFVVSSG
jgi:hypothetical protein